MQQKIHIRPGTHVCSGLIYFFYLPLLFSTVAKIMVMEHYNKVSKLFNVAIYPIEAKITFCAGDSTR